MAVPPPSPKAKLRRELRARRLAFTGDPQAIEQRLTSLLAQEGPIAGYIAHKGEPDVLPFLMRAFHLGHAVALPRPGSETLDFIRWHPDLVMEPGIAGIPQPMGGEPIAPGIVLAPLLGFDRVGHRLGQGGGYYDRWFTAHPQAMRIGIAWSVQEVEALVPEPWDVPLHAIVTEKEWIAP
ncbi:5-formyltetrahydrofolate cyclo-ligase [Sphingomonas oryzagri]